MRAKTWIVRTQPGIQIITQQKRPGTDGRIRMETGKTDKEDYET